MGGLSIVYVEPVMLTIRIPINTYYERRTVPVIKHDRHHFLCIIPNQGYCLAILGQTYLCDWFLKQGAEFFWVRNTDKFGVGM